MDFNIESFSNLITEKLSNWIEALIKLLPNMILAAIILILGLMVSKLAKKTALRIVSKISRSPTLNNLFASVIYLTFIGITIFTVLSVLNLDKAVTSILAGAGILGLALAFAFQDIASNFISGIFISLRKPLKVGDIVKIKNYMGKVQEVNLRDTVMQTFNGETVIIPNKDVFQNPIENFSYLGKRRLELNVGVSYGEDLEKVKQITLDCVKDIEDISSTDEITLFFYEFGESSINLSVRIWINSTEQQIYKKVCNDAIMRIKNAYDRNSIVIPFPIRTLDFGIKGGKTLSEMELKIKKNK